MDYVLPFNMIHLIGISGFKLVPYSFFFFYYRSVEKLEIKKGGTFNGSFIVWHCLSHPELFVFPYEVENFPFMICKELCLCFDGDCFESIDWFWQGVHFCYANHIDLLSWKIFLTSLISFFKDLKFLTCWILICILFFG